MFEMDEDFGEMMRTMTATKMMTTMTTMTTRRKIH